MRRLIAITAALMSLAGATSVEATEPPEAVSIDYAMAFTGPGTAAGTWSATGAISGAGTVAETFTVTPDPPPVQVAHVTRSLTGTGGTLTLRATVRLVSFANGIAVYEGPWHVQSATGAYAGLTGGGTFLAHVDVSGGFPTFAVNEMEGSVHSR